MDEEKRFENEGKQSNESNGQVLDLDDTNSAVSNTTAKSTEPNYPRKKKTPIVPIVIGAVVALVVIIAIIAVLIGISSNGGSFGHSHSYGEWDVVREATCLMTGLKTRTCECGDEEIEDIPANGHSFDSWTTIKSATCLEDGKRSRSCNNCSESETMTISATGHSYSHGICTNCNKITDAYEALAYYIYKNGTRDSEGDCFISTSYESSYFYIYTDSEGKTLSFRMLSYSNNSSAFISLDFEDGFTSQEVYMLWEDYYCKGTINIETFNSTTKYVSSFYTDCPYSTLKSSLKDLMGSEISLMFIGSNLLIAVETDLDITMADLGISNYD